MNEYWQNFFNNHKKHFSIIAGPCSIESLEQLEACAEQVKNNNATMLRGGIYKLRTSPDSFQGLGQEALAFAQKAKNNIKRPFIAEITDPRQLEAFNEVVDIIQVGSRNMYNYSLLKELGQQSKPVMLKRGFSATIDEWLKAAEYIKNAGNSFVILCERGIRGFDSKTRNVLDLGSVAYLKKYSDEIVYVDPSHACGDKKLVADLAKAAIMAGADGLMLEIHPKPSEALSDGQQALDFPAFNELVYDIKKILPLLNKELSSYEL